MNLVATFQRRLKENENIKYAGQTAIIVVGIIALDLLMIATVSLFAEHLPFLAVALGWFWFLLPGLMLSFALAAHVSWWERIPISFVLTIGVATPITIAAILLHLSLNQFKLLHTGILIISAVIWILYRWQSRKTHAFVSSFIPRIGAEKLKENIILLLFACVIMIGVLTFLAHEWPLFGDEVAGLSLFAEVTQLNRITGTEPFHGTDVPVTPRNELIAWTYMAILTDEVSGASPTDFFINSRPILVAIAILSLATLLNQSLKNKYQVLFLLCLWSIYLLATTQADGTGSDLITRIIQDKFLGWFVVIPIVLVFALWFVEGLGLSKLAGFSIVTFGASMVHPITLTQAMILVGGFGLIHFVIDRSRRTFINLLAIVFVLLLCTVIPFLQYIRFNTYSPVILAGLGDAVEFGKLSSAVGRYRLWLLGGGRYILHPIVILEPIIIAAYILLPVIIFQIRKHYAACLIVGTLFILPVLLYTPTFAALAGRVVTPYLIWRLAWPLPLFAVLTIGWVLWLLVQKLGDWLKAYNSQVLIYNFLYPGLLILGLFFAMPKISAGLMNYSERKDEVSLSTCETAKNVLSYLDKISREKSVNVLSSHGLNFCIPGYAAQANVVEFRGYGTINRLSEDNLVESVQRVEDVNYFDVAKLFDDLMWESLIRHDIDYILIEKESLELDLQLKLMPSYFEGVYEDGNYNLYVVRKPLTPSKIVEANTYLRLYQYKDAKENFTQILEEDPKNVLANLGLGIAQVGLGEIDQAIISYHKTLEYAPDEPALHAKLAGAYLLKADVESAIKEYQVATNLSPQRYSLQIALGQTYILAGRDPEARAIFEKVASLRAIKDTAAYYSILGRVYQSMSLFTEAIRYEEIAISIEPDTDSYVNLARSLSLSGKIEEAEVVYKKASELDRWNPVPHLDLGYLYKNQGRIDEAIAELEIACQLKPTNVSVYILLGQAEQEKSGLTAAIARLDELKNMSSVLPGPYRGEAMLMAASGDFNEAIQALGFSANVQPKSAAILTAKGYMLMANGQMEEAQAAFDQSLLYNPDLISARIGLSLLYTSEGGFDLETGQLLQIAQLAPMTAWPHLNLAQAYKRQGNWELAQKEIEWAIKLEPDNVEGYLARGDLYKAQLNFDLAISDYSQALNIDPENLKALIGLGDVYHALANISEAERVYKLAAQIDEESVYPKLKLAEVYWQQGRFEEATALEEAAAKIDSDSDLVLVKLADTYKMRGKIEEARTLYERVIQIDPGMVAAYSALAQLTAEEDFDQNMLLSLFYELQNATEESAEVYLVVGQFFINQGELDQAEQVFNSALTFPDVSIDNYISLSDLQQKLGERENALSTLQTALAVFPEKKIIFNKLADFYLKSGDINNAEIYFDKVIEIAPGFIPAHVGKSQIEQIRGNLNHAEQVLQAAITKNPGAPEIFFAMASFQESIGRFDSAEENLDLALEIMPSDINALRALGQFYARQKRLAEASDVFQDALSLPGSKMEIYLDLGDLHLAEKQVEEAIGWYRAASLINRSDVRPYLKLASLYQSIENWDKALETLDTALYIEPANVEANLAMGELNRRLDRIEVANAYFERAWSFDQSQIEALIALAEISRHKGDFEQAITYLEQAIGTSPTSLLAYTYLTGTYLLFDDQEQAQAVISQGIQKTFDKQAAYLARAKFYENQGIWDLAQADYEKAWSIAPHSISASLTLVDFLLKQNKLDLSLAVLNQLESLVGEASDMRRAYGDVYTYQSKWDKAIEAYQQAIDLTPTAPDAYIGLARIYEKQGDIERAIALYKTGVNSVSNEPELLIALGEVLQSQGKYEEADATFRDALLLDPMNSTSLLHLEQINKILQKPEMDLLVYAQNALVVPSSEAFNTIAQLYQYRGDWKLALSWYQRAVSLEPYDRENWLSLGNCYRGLHLWDQALKAYDQAFKYKPASMDIHLAKGSVEEELGMLDSAKDSYQRAIEMNPLNIEGYVALSKLHFQMGETEQSLAIINDGISHVPGDYRGYQTLGDIYISIGPENHLQAEEAYLQGLGIVPGAAELYVRIGNLYAEHVLASRERLEAAQALENLAQYQLEILLDSSITPGTRRRIGSMELTIDEATQLYDRYQKGLVTSQQEFDLVDIDFEKAMDNYVNALKLDANNELSLLGIGKLQLAKGSTDEAVRYFEMASATNPDSILALSYLGHIYLELGQPHKAIEAFEQIMVYEPGNLLAQMGLIDAYNDLPTLSISQAASSVEQNLFKLPSLIEHFRKVEIRDGRLGSY